MNYRSMLLIGGVSFFVGQALVGRDASSFVQPVIKSTTVYTTARDTGQRLAETDGLGFADISPLNEKQQYVFVDPGKSFQTILGIGGALTDASAETFNKLPADKQQEILRAYFDRENGIGYSLGRVSIGSCDFSSQSFNYVADHD